ncbi:hypothetical protein DYB25_000882 [Aphanomyces astaci]|uniref:Uncharacterized protein n=1 Tax=Aphanomyces astaci TaxID=112090 RepID=A0A397BX01_APHAT|nr:hypothetical protein DYB25_000882 [Aphanomyces astaci]
MQSFESHWAVRVDASKETAALPRNPSPATLPSFECPRRSWFSSLHAVFSFAAGILVLYVYISGCTSSLQSLVGTHYGIDGTKTVYAQYESPYMLAMVHNVKQSPISVAADLRLAILTNVTFPTAIVYLVPAISGDATYAFSTTACAVDGTVGEIHTPSAILDFVGRVFQGLEGASNLPRDDVVVLIDCSFDAILTQDSSTFRAHVVDPSLTYILTMTTEALILQRPLLRESTIALPVFVVNVTFASIKPVPLAMQVPGTHAFARPLNQILDVRAVVAIGAPFVLGVPFQPMYIDAITETSKFVARIPRPDGSFEDVTLMGTDGAYVQADTVFGWYYSYCFNIPSDAVVNLASQQFLGVPNSKNAYACGYFIVTVYLCARVTFLLVSAAVVAVGSTNYRRHVGLVHTLPDIAHQVTSVLIVHACLSIGSCLLDRGWGLYEWSDVSAKLRTKANRAVIPPPAHIRCLLVSWVVVICHVMAKRLRICFSLTVVVVVTVAFDANLTLFNGEVWGLNPTFSQEFVQSTNMDSLIPSHPGHLDVWMYHSLKSMDIRFFLNEVSAYMWSTSILLAGQLVLAVGLRCVSSQWQSQRIQPQDSGTTFILEERSTSVDVFGLGSSFAKRVVAPDGSMYVPVEWAWHLGYVVVDHTYLFKLHDLPKLFLNVLFDVDSFYIYGYHMKNNQVDVELTHFHCQDFASIRSLLRLSLRPLSQEWPVNEAKAHVQLYEQASRKRNSTSTK